MSAFAQPISALDRTLAKNGHSSRILRSCSIPCRSRAPRSAVPSPSQPGSRIRDCVHENTHGIARRSPIPAARERFAGREPSRSCEISATGVTA